MTHYGLAFDQITGTNQQRQLRDFMLAHPGGYDVGRHTAWVEDVCMPSLETGARRALAWWRDGLMIGNVVLKPNVGANVEVKNFRVVDFTQRGLAGFMLRQALYESGDMLDELGQLPGDTNSFRIVLDTPAGSGAESFFAAQGFAIDARRVLYAPGQLDSLMSREVSLS